MHLCINQRAPIARETEVDFFSPILVDLFALARPDRSPTHRISELNKQQEFIVGRMWAERWELALSEDCGYQPSEVAEVSPVWTQVAETLMRGRRKFRSDLGIEGVVLDLLFLHEVLLHPDIEDRVAVMDAMLRPLVGINSLVLMHYEQGESHHLEDHEYRDLGFCKIARSNLLMKDTSLRYPFADQHPAGKSVSLTGSSEQESWLLDNWDKLLSDHPAL